MRPFGAPIGDLTTTPDRPTDIESDLLLLLTTEYSTKGDA